MAIKRPPAAPISTQIISKLGIEGNSPALGPTSVPLGGKINILKSKWEIKKKDIEAQVKLEFAKNFLIEGNEAALRRAVQLAIDEEEGKYTIWDDDSTTTFTDQVATYQKWTARPEPAYTMKNITGLRRSAILPWTWNTPSERLALKKTPRYIELSTEFEKNPEGTFQKFLSANNLIGDDGFVSPTAPTPVSGPQPGEIQTKLGPDAAQTVGFDLPGSSESKSTAVSSAPDLPTPGKTGDWWDKRYGKTFKNDITLGESRDFEFMLEDYISNGYQDRDPIHSVITALSNYEDPSGVVGQFPKRIQNLLDKYYSAYDTGQSVIEARISTEDRNKFTTQQVIEKRAWDDNQDKIDAKKDREQYMFELAQGELKWQRENPFKYRARFIDRPPSPQNLGDVYRMAPDRRSQYIADLDQFHLTEESAGNMVTPAAWVRKNATSFVNNSRGNPGRVV